MKISRSHFAVVSAVVLLFALSGSCTAIDWKTFEDPKAFLYFTNDLAKQVSELPSPEKPAAIKRLQDLLKSNEVEIRRRAALTLSKLGDKSGVPTMIEDLSKATGRDRDSVAVALRILKDERAIPALRKALKDESPYVRSIAVAALGELKATVAYDEIVALTKDKEYSSPQSRDALNCVRIPTAAIACYALGALGDQRAIPVLIDLLTDEELQNSALQALKALTKQDFGLAQDKWKKWRQSRQ